MKKIKKEYIPADHLIFHLKNPNDRTIEISPENIEYIRRAYALGIKEMNKIESFALELRGLQCREKNISEDVKEDLEDLISEYENFEKDPCWIESDRAQIRWEVKN
jgi:hypothetical protein